MPGSDRPIAVSNPLFHLLLWIVTGVCFATLALIACLAFWGSNPATDAQKNLMELCRYAFTTTLGALVGLLCGRGAAPDYLGQLPTQTAGSAPSTPVARSQTPRQSQAAGKKQVGGAPEAPPSR
jgi:hypothetical protein